MVGDESSPMTQDDYHPMIQDKYPPMIQDESPSKIQEEFHHNTESPPMIGDAPMTQNKSSPSHL